MNEQRLVILLTLNSLVLCPVSAADNAANLQQPVAIWSGDQSVPGTSAMTILDNVGFHVIKKWEPEIDGYRWLHGVALTWHKEKLYAAFGHNKGHENTVTEEARYCVSSDGGSSWSRIQTVDVGTESDDLAVSHGVFHSHNGSLWAFLGAFHGTRKRVHSRAYVLEESTGQWRSQGVVVDGGFWPMTQPVRMENGNWIMPGFVVSKDNPAAVAICDGDNLKKWTLVKIPVSDSVQKMWGESSIVVDGTRVLNIARYGSAASALTAVSNDYGRTWSPSSISDLPMTTSKPCAGTLSTGQPFLICTTTADSGYRRSPLTIAVGRPGEMTFCRTMVIRHAEFPAGPGESARNASLSYPYAVEHQGKLYVGYSNSGGRRGNENSAEMAVIDVKSLSVAP